MELLFIMYRTQITLRNYSLLVISFRFTLTENK